MLMYHISNTFFASTFSGGVQLWVLSAQHTSSEELITASLQESYGYHVVFTNRSEE